MVETAPELSAAELAALRLVPASQLGRNVGVSVNCETTYWALAAFGAGLLGIGLLGTPGSGNFLLPLRRKGTTTCSIAINCPTER